MARIKLLLIGIGKYFSSVLLVLFLTACSSDNYEAPLRVGTHKWIGYETFYLADKMGLYDEANLRFARMLSASDQMHAIRSNNLEVVTLTLDEALGLIDEGYRGLKVILMIDNSFGGDAVVAKPYIETAKDLKGKTIAVEHTAVGHVMLEGLLQQTGLKLEDVTIIPCTIDRHIECFEEADAVITFEPYRSYAIKKGGKVVFDSAQIPDRIVDVLVATEKAIKENPESLQALIDGYFKALAIIKNDRQKAARIIAPRLEMSSDSVLESYELIKIPTLEENRKLLVGNAPAFDDKAHELSRLYAKHNILSGPIDTRGLSYGQFVEAVKQ